MDIKTPPGNWGFDGMGNYGWWPNGIPPTYGSPPPLNAYGQPIRGGFGLRHTPISEAVHMHLASLPRLPSSSESMSDSALLLSCIQSQRWHKQLQDEMSGQDSTEWQIDTTEAPQSASEPQLEPPKWLEKMDQHPELIHTLLSKLQQDTGKD